MNFKDPHVVHLSWCLLGALLVVLLYAATISLLIVIDWRIVTEGAGPGNDKLAWFAGQLPILSGQQADELFNTVGVFLTALPLALTPICFTQAAAGRIMNGFGKLFATGLLLVCSMALAAYAMLDPTAWADGHVMQGEGLSNVREWAKTALRGSVFYLATLLGIKGAQ